MDDFFHGQLGGLGERPGRLRCPTGGVADRTAVARLSKDRFNGLQAHRREVEPPERLKERLRKLLVVGLAPLRERPALVERFREVHPELAFLVWNGGQPLAHGKRCREGRAERLALCDQGFPGAWEAIRGRFPRAAVADDDILDALALLRSAGRLWRGEATVLPEAEPEVDGCGLPMAIAY